ncbi:hypothetical protein ACX80U_12265 [Arthrobacter sp. TmT3-37]
MLEEGLNLEEVWLYYFANAGTATEVEFTQYALRQIDLPELQLDLISLALRDLVTNIRELENRFTL